MPGIAGVLASRDLPAAPKLLEAMLTSMMHEPGDGQTSSSDFDHGWFVGGTFHSDGPCSPMPARNEYANVSVWLAGECFVDTSTRTALQGNGHAMAWEGSDCLVHIYEEDGPGFVKKLNGLFSGIVLDARVGRALVFTDRYSARRLYYHEDASGFYFASEAKAILAALPHLRSMDCRSLADYLCFDCVLEGRSFFPGVEVLPGGALWTSERGRLEKACTYDTRAYADQPRLSAEEVYDRLGSAFERSVRRCLRGGKVALALSGGQDTRLIASCLPADCDSLTAYTAGGMYRESMDLRIARKVSRVCHLEHETILLDREYLANYASIAGRAVYVTDGLVDATTAHLYYLDEKVRRRLAPVAITGDFGSQVLGRVRPGLRYRPPASGLIHRDFMPYVEGSAAAFAEMTPESNLAYMVKREIPWYWARYTTVHLSQLNLRLPFLDNDFIDLLFRVPHEGYDGSGFEIAAITSRKPELMRLRTNQGRGGSAPEPISSLVRRCIQYRAKAEKVFNWDVLPHSLHDVAARVDAHLLSPLRLDRFILGWEYYSHYNRWFRKELAATLKEILLDPKTLARPYWNPECVRWIVEDHVAGLRNNLSQIRKIVTVELVHRELLEA